MQIRSEKSLKTLLQNKDSNLNHILLKVDLLHRLDQWLKSFLEPELAAHCMVANFRESILVIQCESAAWATRIKFIMPQILNFMRHPDRLPQLASISLLVEKF